MSCFMFRLPLSNTALYILKIHVITLCSVFSDFISRFGFAFGLRALGPSSLYATTLPVATPTQGGAQHASVASRAPSVHGAWTIVNTAHG